MKASFHDQENLSNPLNGYQVAPTEMAQILRSLQKREPFFCSVKTESGTLLVGVGQELGCIQFTPKNGGPPYLMATTGSVDHADDYVEFLSGGTWSPVPRRYCLPWILVERSVVAFLERGVVPGDLKWEEV
jgi:hypothetical protein